MAANEYKYQRQAWLVDTSDERSIHTTTDTARQYMYVRSCEMICHFFLDEGHPKRMPVPLGVYQKVLDLLEICDQYLLANFPDAYVDGSETRESLLQPRKAWRKKR